MGAMPDGSDTSDSCCTQTTPDEESGANPADLCKTGQTCQSGALSALPAAGARQFADFGQVTGRFRSTLHAGDSSQAVWRPPRSL